MHHAVHVDKMLIRFVNAPSPPLVALGAESTLPYSLNNVDPYRDLAGMESE